MDAVSYRLPLPDDVSFIYATFLKGLRHGNTVNRALPSRVFYPRFHDKLTAILESPGTVVTVACLTEAPEIILGYSVTSQDTLHCIYVKKAYRSAGIGRKLLPPAVKRVSFATDAFSKVLAELGITVEEP